MVKPVSVGPPCRGSTLLRCARKRVGACDESRIGRYSPQTIQVQAPTRKCARRLKVTRRTSAPTRLVHLLARWITMFAAGHIRIGWITI